MASDSADTVDANGQTASTSSSQLVARVGRERQRYAEDGERLIAGCAYVGPGSPAASVLPRFRVAD